MGEKWIKYREVVRIYKISISLLIEALFLSIIIGMIAGAIPAYSFKAKASGCFEV